MSFTAALAALALRVAALEETLRVMQGKGPIMPPVVPVTGGIVHDYPPDAQPPGLRKALVPRFKDEDVDNG